MCDECKTVFEIGVALHSCETCDHDVCNACATKLHKPPSATNQATTTILSTAPTAVPLSTTTMTAAGNLGAVDTCTGGDDDGDDAPTAAITGTTTTMTVPPTVQKPMSERLGNRLATTVTSTTVPSKRPMAMRLGNANTGNGGCMRLQQHKRGCDQQHDASGECTNSDRVVIVVVSYAAPH